MIECPRCQDSPRDGKVYAGTTITLASKYKTCPTCNGKEVIKISGKPPFTECPTCGGSGQTGDTETCKNCKGTGILQGDIEEY